MAKATFTKSYQLVAPALVRWCVPYASRSTRSRSARATCGANEGEKIMSATITVGSPRSACASTLSISV